jgi:hypothetical protein
MTTVMEPVHSETEHSSHSNAHYYYVALALACLTGLEVALTYVHIGAAFMPLLLILMGVKFLMVVSEFMHLRKDAAVFKWLFWSGFVLALGVYVGFLATFKFFLKA